jgi:hypothetical protein
VKTALGRTDGAVALKGVGDTTALRGGMRTIRRRPAGS